MILTGRLGSESSSICDWLNSQLAVVDVARVAFGARDGDGLAFPDLLRRVAAADDGGDAEFARDDRGMAGAAATVGDDRRRALHHRLPVRVGHVGDEHVAGLDARHLANVADDACRAGADALADAAARREHRSFLLQRVALDRAAGAALDRLGPRLQHVDLAGVAVLAPFDVHRAAVVIFDDQRLLREFDEVGVADAEAHAVGFGDVDGQHALLGLGRRRVDHLDRLGAERAPQDRLVAVAQRRLVDVELVRVHGALHDGFAEAVGRGDEHHVAEARIGVEREHDAARAEVAADHVLDAGRQRDQRVIEALVHAVGDRAVVEQRREDFVHGLDDVVGAAHVEERFLLARERSFRQVFRRGG